MKSLDLNEFLKCMVAHDASDVYLTVDSRPMYRVLGSVQPIGKQALTDADTQEIAESIMNESQHAEFSRTNELNLALYNNQLGRFRVNIMRQRGSVALVIRQIKTEIPSLESLFLPNTLQEIIMEKRGLVLMVGATGCGKSTSLASMIDFRNAHSGGHIISVEDPIEFVHSHKQSIITQREIGLDTRSYHDALRNCLRQAPDVIMIGEIRDLETMESAITFAETGHLAVATLHCNNANQAMERIMNFFPVERHKQIYLQLSLNLKAIISQRLVRRCDIEGRIPAVEILLSSPRVKDLIYKGEIAELKEAMENSRNLGMQTFDQSLYDLYLNGYISLEDALKNADSANNLRLRIKLSEGGDNEKLKTSHDTRILKLDEQEYPNFNDQPLNLKR